MKKSEAENAERPTPNIQHRMLNNAALPLAMTAMIQESVPETHGYAGDLKES